MTRLCGEGETYVEAYWATYIQCPSSFGIYCYAPTVDDHCCTDLTGSQLSPSHCCTRKEERTFTNFVSQILVVSVLTVQRTEPPTHAATPTDSILRNAQSNTHSLSAYFVKAAPFSSQLPLHSTTARFRLLLLQPLFISASLLRRTFNMASLT
ncbi:hypothetical protein K504DRAFT_525594 [Pleomassaria siparia CBS 279.74]|uniref:Uncharacterized protein n=1 Tax=Pleomassaria siparia CBS 279.74 TaxID=1314801 RepID=A0A6G1KCJ8_9PLEO|nr:hypothetical protein K504DRAFT_525594 [Pleomassaria siparia CBS 279.74]